MEKFKQSIKRRVLLLSILVIICLALGIQNFMMIGNTENGSLSEGIVAGFQSGLIVGIAMKATIDIILLTKAMKDDKKMRLLYNKENDERMKVIRSKAGMPMVMITSVMMLTAAIVAGYFNIVVFYTLVIAAMVQLTIGATIKLYLMKTM